MKRWWNNFLWDYEDAIIFTIACATGIVIFVGSIVYALGFFMGQQDQYNCNLIHRPSIKTELLINHDTYGYNPEGFCNQLKEKIAK
jgi:hypothetical protein